MEIEVDHPFSRETSFLPYFRFFETNESGHEYEMAKFKLRDEAWEKPYPNNYNVEIKEGYENEIKNCKQKLREIVHAANNYARSLFKAEVMNARQKGRYTSNMYEEIEESVDNMFNY